MSREMHRTSLRLMGPNRTRWTRKTDFTSRGIAFYRGRSLRTVSVGGGFIDANDLLKQIIPETYE